MHERVLLTAGLAAAILAAPEAATAQVRRLSRDELLDRIRGGWIGQMVGNVQGLPFEFKYKDEPGPLPEFTPNLARCPSDDDTDIEWLHLHLMERHGTLEVPYAELARDWVQSVNRGIWVSNKAARELIGNGILPPWTSHPAYNPHARYNLSGQFCAEAYGFLAPGLPSAAARLGRHYLRVTVRGEPIQACAYTTALIASAFFEHDVERLITGSLTAVDPASQQAEMVRDVLAWWRAAPDDWVSTRARIQAKYRDQRGWNMNATVTNGALVVAALLYGRGDFVETLRLSFAMGYDADCNAATCGAVLGVIHGAMALEGHPGWVLPTVYDNRTRDGLPATESLDALTELTARLAEKLLEANGASREGAGEQVAWLIPTAPATLLEPLDSGPQEGTEQADEQVDREALARLDGGGPAATFAAVRLAHRAAGLTEAQRQQVRRILDAATRDDAVLADTAKAAMAVIP